MRIPQLSPSQLSELLKFLTGKQFASPVIACWLLKKRAKAESWCDWQIQVHIMGWNPPRGVRPQGFPGISDSR